VGENISKISYLSPFNKGIFSAYFLRDIV